MNESEAVLIPPNLGFWVSNRIVSYVLERVFNNSKLTVSTVTCSVTKQIFDMNSKYTYSIINNKAFLWILY